MVSGIKVGDDLVIAYKDVWHEGVIVAVPLGRRRANTPRMFRVSVPSLASPNNVIVTELLEDNYATGCVTPSTIGDRWAWARVDTYLACAYVASGKCDRPYDTAVGHHCIKCQAALHLLCSSKHGGRRALGSEVCDKCRR